MSRTHSLVVARGQASRAAYRRRANLQVEELESRVVLNGAPIDTWTGAVSSDWFNASNWSSGVPNYTTNVSIPASTPTCVISGGSPLSGGIAQANQIEVDGGNLDEQSHLSINTQFSQISGSTTIESEASVYGSFSAVVSGGNLNVAGFFGPITFSQISGSTTVEQNGYLSTYQTTVSGGSLDVQGSLSASGSFSQISGSTTIEQTGYLFTYTFGESGGTVTLAGGTMASTDANLTGGALYATGSMNVSNEVPSTLTNNGGTLVVTGSFTLTGSYNQTSTGTLVFSNINSTSGPAPFQIITESRGSEPDGDGYYSDGYYGDESTPSTASLGGALKVIITGTAGAGTYPLIAYPSETGTFSSVTGTLPSNLEITGETYGASEFDVVIGIIPTPPAPTPTPTPAPASTPPQIPGPLTVTALGYSPTTSIYTTTTSTSSSPGQPSGPSSPVYSAIIIYQTGIRAEYVVPPSTNLVHSGGGGVFVVIAKPDILNRAMAHGLEEYDIDRALAGDVDELLRVQSRSFVITFERDVLSGLSIVRALLTGTTPRSDLSAEGQPVGAVATLTIGSDNHLSTVRPAASEATAVDLSQFLIDPTRTFLTAPDQPVSRGPTTPPGQETTWHSVSSWFNSVLLLRILGGIEPTEEPRRPKLGSLPATWPDPETLET